MARTRQLVGLVTLLALVVIVLGITGVQVPTPGLQAAQPTLQGVKARAATTLLRAPEGGELAFMTVDLSGSLIVSDAKRASVQRYDVTGHLLSEWGPQLGTTRLVEPAGVAVAGDSYYVLDRGTPRIIRLDNTGQPHAVFDLQQLGPYGLNGLAVDAAGNIYAADTGRNRILVFSPGGQFVKQIGHAGADLGGFTQPMMLAFAPDGGLFVSDWENGRIERFSSSLEATDAWSLGFRAFGVAVDGLGRVYVPDFDGRRIEAFTPQGQLLGEIGGPDSPSVATAPKQVAVARSPQPSLYVLGADQIQRLDLDNTPPPPQSGGPGSDLLSVLAIGLLLALLALAVLSRRQRRGARPRAASLGATFERPVGLHAEDPAQRQQHQARADEELLVAHQAERKE